MLQEENFTFFIARPKAAHRHVMAQKLLPPKMLRARKMLTSIAMRSNKKRDLVTFTGFHKVGNFFSGIEWDFIADQVNKVRHVSYDGFDLLRTLG